MSVVDVRSGQFVVKVEHARTMLNFASLGANSNKFYLAVLEEGTGVNDYRIYTEYGRLAQGKPRQQARYFSNLYQAQSEFDKIIRSKKKKGYAEVETDDGLSSKSVSIKSSKPKQDLSKVKDKVLQFIGGLYTYSTSYLVKSIQTPLGNLSSNQVAKGLKILNEIETELDNKTTSTGVYSRLSDEFYSVIPFVFGRNVDIPRMMIDDYKKLNDRKDLLGVISSVVKVQNSLEKTLEDKYKALNIKLKHLDGRTKDYKRIVKWVEESKSSHHRANSNVTNIFKVDDMTGFDKFNPYDVKTMELFHGTRNENVLNILQTGLKSKPKSAVHTGSMFGSGIYFASQSSKSANYSTGFGSVRNEKYYMFVCEVATGRVKDYEDAQPGLYAAPHGYNSVRGKKGRSLLHDEYIVYHENQVKVKYIIEYTR